MEASLDRVEARQSNALGALEDRYDSRIRRIRSVLNQLGVRPETAATGGPFVPVRPPPAGEGFQRALFRVNLARSEAEQLADTLRTLPVRKPLAGDIDETSPFGVREDPFRARSRRCTPAWTCAARSVNRSTQRRLDK